MLLLEGSAPAPTEALPMPRIAERPPLGADILVVSLQSCGGPTMCNPACPACGAALPDDAPQGLCPACLMGFALPSHQGDAPPVRDALSDGGRRAGLGSAGEPSTLGGDEELRPGPEPFTVRYFGDYE